MALADLPPAEQEALLLVYWGGLSHRETAASLGTSVSAIKVRIHRGRAHLQTMLQPEFGTPTRPVRHLAQGVNMIPVQIHDVLARVTDVDLRPYLQPVTCPAARRYA